MPRLSRKTFNSGFFHIMIQGINKEYIFKENEDKKKYLYLMKKYYREYKVKIISYCIMNNHSHFIIYSEDVNQISEYMHKINTAYAKYYNETNKRVGYVFRDRYKSQYIYDREYLLKCIKYIHMNPVKAHIVKEEKQYLYSSYNDFENKTGYVDDEAIMLIFKDKENYIKLFNNISEVDIEIMDIDNDEENFDIAVKSYVEKTGLDIEQIKKNKIYLYDFAQNMIEKRI